MASNSEYEHRVQHFLVENTSTFIASQYPIAYDKQADVGGSNPDFVIIRPGRKECFVVEVSVSGSTASLAEKVKRRQQQWLIPLRRKLEQIEVMDSSWKEVEVLVFIKQDEKEKFKERVMKGSTLDGLHIWPIEFTLAHWNWPKCVRQPDFDFRNIDETLKAHPPFNPSR